jgi:sulfate permease
MLILATLVVAPCFAIGSSVFGGDLVEKVGKDLLALGPATAVTISVVTATLLLTASLTRGIPTSLVQMNIAAIMGMSIAKHGWQVLRQDTPLWRMCRVWFAAPIIAFALSFAATAVVVKSGLVG